MKIPSIKKQISNKSQCLKFQFRNRPARPWVQHLKALRRPNKRSPIQNVKNCRYRNTGLRWNSKQWWWMFRSLDI